MSIRSRRTVKNGQDQDTFIEIVVMILLVLATLVFAFPMG